MITNLAEMRKGKVKAQEIEIPGIMRVASLPCNINNSKRGEERNKQEHITLPPRIERQTQRRRENVYVCVCII